MADTREIDLLAELLDGTLDPSQAPAELAKLAGLADAVRTSAVLVPPTPAFRDALRDQVLSDVASSIASGAAGGAGGAGAAASAITPLQAIAAAVAAATVLAGGGVAALAPGAVPGDALYGAKRTIESAQLAVGGVERDVRLLLDLTTERVEEALGLADTAIVLDLLAESEAHLDEALSLLGELDPDEAAALLDEALRARAAALDTLVATTTDLTVGVRADQLRDASRAMLPVPAETGGDAVTDGETDLEGSSDAPDGDAGESQLPVDVDATDDATDPVQDVIEDATDPVDDIVEVDPDDLIDDVVDDVVEDLPDVTDEPTDLGEDLLGP